MNYLQNGLHFIQNEKNVYGEDLKPCRMAGDQEMNGSWD